MKDTLRIRICSHLRVLGKRGTRTDFAGCMIRIIKEIGAEHVRFHDMRHTFATLSLKSGVDVRTLSETLGHFSAGFTLSTYVHSTPGMKQSAADAIGNTIRNAI